MKKISLSLILSLIITGGLFAQDIMNAFFDKVNYIGAFDGASNWTYGWTEWNPVTKVYPDATVTKGNGQFSRSSGLHITANETWSGVIKLDGWVYVDEGATLTIAAGTIIRGTQKSALVVERGAKIMAVGTQTNPIVFTSNKGAGLRSNSDWAGLVICGKAINNIAGGVGVAEGGIESQYGGTVANDNSGELKYVRIEFPGYEVATGKEVNGLTLCSVGSATQINYVQVSYSGDDGYEWFGGSVNAKYLISYKTEDDDFDTDNGFSGMVQFGLISRDPDIAEIDDAANGFESDNDASGSGATPFTSAIFSNISAFGPAKSATEPLTLKTYHAGGSALRLRRNTKLQIYNSAFLGWGMGLRLESDGSQTAANTDVLTIKNTIISGIRGDKFKEDGTVFDAASLQAWFLNGSRENQLINNNADVKITDPFNYIALNFQPAAGSLVFDASYWIPTAVNPIAISNETKLVNYPNPFSGSTNIEIQLEKASYVRVFVIDMAGRTVVSLQEGNLTEGKHRFVFDGTALPKGLYFAKVVNGSDQKVVKMISK
ncbi:MAG: T9SS type A sorting domain-containing protein [Bacteroidota bacterium]|nr:T9SS type A sorting domain-containing protein [Bacteroidota bacterium]